MSEIINTIFKQLESAKEEKLRAEKRVSELTRNVEDNIYINFGRWLKRTRTARGWTQEKLGEQIGLGRTSITNIEKGKQKILLDDLFKFAYIFGVSAQKILDELES